MQQIHPQQQKLKDFFKDQYHKAHSLQKRFVLLTNWHQVLCRYAELSKPPYNSTKALTARKLLSITKNQSYLEFYQHQSAAVIDYHLYQNVIAARNIHITNPAEILYTLNQHLSEISEQIKRLEQDLRSGSWTTQLITNGLLLGTENYYYKFAENYIFFFEELTTKGTLKNYPILNTQLTPFSKKICTIIASALLIAMDQYFFTTRGVAYALSVSLNKLLYPDLDLIITRGTRLGLSDNVIIKSVVFSELLFGLALYLSITGIFLGFNAEMMFFLALNYFLAQSLRWTSGVILDTGRNYFLTRSDTQKSRFAYNFFIRAPIQHITAACGQRFFAPLLYSSVRTFFKPKPTKDQLLSDERLCRSDSEACKKAALEVLELPDDVDAAQVSSRFKHLALQYHPDKTQTVAAQEKFISISRAKAVLDDLLDTTNGEKRAAEFKN